MAVPAATPVVALIQARMGSSRLPGKVLVPVAGRSLLEHLVQRLRQCQTLDAMAVATTESRSDDPIEKACQTLAIPCIRGSELDVLARFAQAAHATGAATVVRVTGDCPLMAPAEVDRVVRGYLELGVDYATNQLPGKQKLPLGYAVEVFSRAALLRAHTEGVAAYAREHVTPYLYEEPGRFRTAWIEPVENAPDLRITVDTPADLQVVRAVLEALDGQPEALTVAGVVAWLRQHPEIAQLNQAIGQKSYRDSAGSWLVLRADSGPQVGLGHVMRLAGLGQAWVQRGGRALLLTRQLPAGLGPRLAGMGLKTQVMPDEIAAGSAEDLAWIRSQAAAMGARAVLIDGYAFRPAWLQQLRAQDLRVACVDDLGAADLQVDLVLMPNAGAVAPDLAISPVLAGALYTPVRAEFTGLSPKVAPQPGRRRLLVTCGGSDPAGLTGLALSAALAVMQYPDVKGNLTVQVDVVLGSAVPLTQVAAVDQLASAVPSVRILREVADMAALMAQADVALTAAGTTCWELAAAGVPMLVVPVAANQATVVQGILSAQAGITAGQAPQAADPAQALSALPLPTAQELERALHRLLTLGDAEWLAMSRAGQALIDGRGAARIADALAPLTF